MYRCDLGYTIEEDLMPRERCHCDDSRLNVKSCKECEHYNHEYDLINQAIESAQCRIYRLKVNEGSTLAHQMKAKNQQELMRITIKALEFYRDEL